MNAKDLMSMGLGRHITVNGARVRACVRGSNEEKEFLATVH